ncbi:MAG TPA: hypothetical protein VK207_08945 [Bacteroidales bacterium]|nr:hypothetical protein [Bacteroidales bacterium]
MKTDKELLEGFRTQFNTGRLFTESNVLVLMGMARGEEKKVPGKVQFECPITKSSCIHIDTGDMSKSVDCTDCEVSNLLEP